MWNFISVSLITNSLSCSDIYFKPYRNFSAIVNTKLTVKAAVKIINIKHKKHNKHVRKCYNKYYSVSVLGVSFR